MSKAIICSEEGDGLISARDATTVVEEDRQRMAVSGELVVTIVPIEAAAVAVVADDDRDRTSVNLPSSTTPPNLRTCA